MTTRALVVGKFYPPHRGHKLLIDAATAGADEVHVVVCARPGENPPAPLPRHARVVLIGDFLAPLDSIRAAVGALAGIPVQGHILQVLDPAEALLPYSGRVRFQGTERERDQVVPRVEGIRGAYAEALEAQLHGLAAMSAAAGWGFGTHRTDHAPEPALLALYAALAR